MRSIIVLVFLATTVYCAPAPVYRYRPMTDWAKAQDHAMSSRAVRLILHGVSTPKKENFQVVMIVDGKEHSAGWAAFYGNKTANFMFDISEDLRKKVKRPPGQIEIALRTKSGARVSYNGMTIKLCEAEIPWQYRR